MGSSKSPGDRTVDLYLSPGPTDVWHRQQSVIDRLEALSEDGSIVRFRVRIWGRRVSVEGPLAETTFHKSSARRIRKFEGWSQRTDRQVELPFEEETGRSEFTGHDVRFVRTPCTCLAIYEDDDLSGVYPSRVDGTFWSVEDTVSFLERNAEATVPVDRVTSSEPGHGE